MDFLQQSPVTMCLGKAAIAAGTTSTYSTTGTTTYAIKGKAFSTAAKANVATPTINSGTASAFNAQAIGTAAAYVFGFDASGTLRVSQGGIENLDAAGNFINSPQFGAIPDTICPIGYLLVRLAPSTATVPSVAAWTFGANNLSAVTGVTYTFVDVVTLPDRPQIL